MTLVVRLDKNDINLIFWVLCLFLCTNLVNASKSYDKSWSVGIITGSLAKNSSFKYYLEPQLRLINDRYVINQTFVLGGLGYQIHKNMIIYAGSGWVFEKVQEGETFHEQRIWQQLSWLVLRNSHLNINSRTRLEERKDTRASELAIRLRQRVWVRIPIFHSDKYSYSFFDEVLLNMNHADWVSPYFFEQNRAFIGFATQVSKSVLIDIGYLNQYINLASTRLDNVVFLNFTVNW